MKNRYEELVAKEAPKSLKVAAQAEETNIDPTNLTVWANPNLTEAKTYLKVAVQMTNTPNEDSIVKSKTTMLEGNQETAIKTLKEVQTRKNPYLHQNHKSRHLNQSTNLYHAEHKQTYVPKNIEMSSIWSYDNYSPHISKDHKIPQRINLGWYDPFSVRQLCLSLRTSYCLVSTKIKAQSKKIF